MAYNTIRKNMKQYLEGQIAKHTINAQVFMKNPVGVAEHPDTMATIEEELILYKQKYRDEVDNNEYKMKYRELLDSHWDQKMKQKSMTELNYDGNHNRGREGEDEENGV